MKKFDRELVHLKQKVAEMGDLTEEMVSLIVESIKDFERDTSSEVFQKEEQLDRMQLAIDHEAVRLLTVYGPVAGDLRFILSVSHITMFLERIGDQAVNICEDIQLLVSKAHSKPLPDLQKMARLVGEMVHDTLGAFLHNDNQKAEKTLSNDDLVDSLNDKIIRELLHDEVVRKALSGPEDLAGPLGQILLARSLERIADQATNICEEVVYMVKGADIRHSEKQPVSPTS